MRAAPACVQEVQITFPLVCELDDIDFIDKTNVGEQISMLPPVLYTSVCLLSTFSSKSMISNNSENTYIQNRCMALQKTMPYIRITTIIQSHICSLPQYEILSF